MTPRPWSNLILVSRKDFFASSIIGECRNGTSVGRSCFFLDRFFRAIGKVRPPIYKLGGNRSGGT